MKLHFVLVVPLRRGAQCVLGDVRLQKLTLEVCWPQSTIIALVVDELQMCNSLGSS